MHPRPLKFNSKSTDISMPTPPLNQSERERNVANMLATLRIEKLEPSDSLKPA